MDQEYPIIADMGDEAFDLIAHPNGPAITDGDLIAVIDIHRDDSEGMKELKMKAQVAWRKYAWPQIVTVFYPN